LWLKLISVPQGGVGVLRYYGGSHIRALIALYPELNLKEEKFSIHWGYLTKRRRCADEFAKSRNFNPLDPEKWYTVSKEEFSGIVSF
jgi:hypothetical protein